MSLLKDDDFGCRPPEPLLCAPELEAFVAIDNAFALGKKVLDLAPAWSDGYHFTSSLVCEFNRIAMHGIYACAGNFRDRYSAPETLSAPNHLIVPDLVREMCEYANSHRDDSFHAAAYLLWRTNWIHPFYDGNGRVSRELCHLAILVKTGDTWQKPLPELIAENLEEYLNGLQVADKKWDGETPDVTELQSLIAGLYCEYTTLSADQ